MHDVDADLPRGEFEGGDAAELREGGLGAGVGTRTGAGGFEVAAADEDDAAIDAVLHIRDDLVHQLLMAGEVDHEGAVPIGLRHDVEGVVFREDAGVADDDVDTAELTHGEVDGVLHGLVLGEVHDDADGPDLRHDVGDFFVDVETDDLCALLGERFGDGEANAGGAAGDEGDFALMHLAGGTFAELGLLEVPVFDVEDVLLAERGPAAGALAECDGRGGAFGDVGDDFGVLQGIAKADDAVAGPHGEARGGVEHGLRARVGFEVAFVVRGEGLDAGGVVVTEHGGNALRADAVIGRQWATCAAIGDVGQRRVAQSGLAGAEAGDLREAASLGDELAEFGEG